MGFTGQSKKPITWRSHRGFIGLALVAVITNTTKNEYDLITLLRLCLGKSQFIGSDCSQSIRETGTGQVGE